MDNDQSEQEYQQYLYEMTREALLEAKKHLTADQLSVLMYHCGFTNDNLE